MDEHVVRREEGRIPHIVFNNKFKKIEMRIGASQKTNLWWKTTTKKLHISSLILWSEVFLVKLQDIHRSWCGIYYLQYYHTTSNILHFRLLYTILCQKETQHATYRSRNSPSISKRTHLSLQPSFVHWRRLEIFLYGLLSFLKLSPFTFSFQVSLSGTKSLCTSHLIPSLT